MHRPGYQSCAGGHHPHLGHTGCQRRPDGGGCHHCHARALPGQGRNEPPHQRSGRQSHAIGFEMRLPTAWNGRYYYQANGGIDGSVVTATGPVGGGSPTTNALQMGFAVLSSDAGHNISAPWWGLDPQARLDYGHHQAVGSLTPMAKNLIKTAYGKAPDRSYLGGCSNGGRHALVGAARYADQYDGILAGAPGMHLPKAAMAQMYKVQQYASIATSTVATGADAGQPDITSAVTPAEFKLLGARIVAKCDALPTA
ncbi:MAG: tannase/feruloyl esterase family alpha/beta hydrolase [Mycobacterium sp.]|nr:tannase/feruloyl esterase family alpha/beta hydrolase [Mycobacterium sp.]